MPCHPELREGSSEYPYEYAHSDNWQLITDYWPLTTIKVRRLCLLEVWGLSSSLKESVANDLMPQSDTFATAPHLSSIYYQPPITDNWWLASNHQSLDYANQFFIILAPMTKLDEILTEHELNNHQLVEVDSEHLNHKMVQKARLGTRPLSKHSQVLIVNALNTLLKPEVPFKRESVFGETAPMEG